MTIEACQIFSISSMQSVIKGAIHRYKQKGPAAVEANNVFHHFTYEGAVSMDTIKDPLQKEAAEIAVNEFGQCPKQLFESPHPRRLVCPSSAEAFAISTAASSGVALLYTNESMPVLSRRAEMVFTEAEG